MQRYRLTVGTDACDVRGFTNTHIQCAVDRAAMLGGGEVELSEGVFHMADSLHLRSHVRVLGQGAATVLRKNAQKGSRVNTYLGYGHYDICVAEPDVFDVGDGVYIRDDNAGGFYSTVGTLLAREGDTWYTSRPHCHDYRPDANAVVETLFPVVSAYDVQDASLESAAIDGNKAQNPTTINGCRGGGVFAMRCTRLAVRGVIVRDGSFDGFSFQTCDEMELADCLAEGCTGHGFHPGSGSNRFHIHGCVGRGNGQCGLYYCLRVRDSLLEDCTFQGNGLHGVSTGGRDSRNVNRQLTVRGNGGCGFYFRKHVRNDAPDANVIECCTLERNAAGDGAAEMLIQGEVDGTRLTGNTISPRPGIPAVLIEPGVLDVEMIDNQIAGEGAGVVDRR